MHCADILCELVDQYFVIEFVFEYCCQLISLIPDMFQSSSGLPVDDDGNHLLKTCPPTRQCNLRSSCHIGREVGDSLPVLARPPIPNGAFWYFVRVVEFIINPVIDLRERWRMTNEANGIGNFGIVVGRAWVVFCVAPSTGTWVDFGSLVGLFVGSGSCAIVHSTQPARADNQTSFPDIVVSSCTYVSIASDAVDNLITYVCW